MKIIFWISLVTSAASFAANAPATNVHVKKDTSFVASIFDGDNNWLADAPCHYIGCWFPPCIQCKADNFTFNIDGGLGVASPVLEGSLKEGSTDYSAKCPTNGYYQNRSDTFTLDCSLTSSNE
jgi:hypothetical protein